MKRSARNEKEIADTASISSFTPRFRISASFALCQKCTWHSIHWTIRSWSIYIRKLRNTFSTVFVEKISREEKICLKLTSLARLQEKLSGHRTGIIYNKRSRGFVRVNATQQLIILQCRLSFVIIPPSWSEILQIASAQHRVCLPNVWCSRAQPTKDSFGWT